MQHFWLAGINYKKSDASARGTFAVSNDQYEHLLSIAAKYGINEFFILSTCNRTEIYGFAEHAARLIDFLCEVTTGDATTFIETAYIKNGQDAIEHLFHVGAGLDSQILGDYEILGQIKNAAKMSKAQGCLGAFLERLVNSVLQSSKAIKTHTALSGGTVSVSFAAVQYIREYFEGASFTPEMKCPACQHIAVPATIDRYIAPTDVTDKKIVLLGTGKIGKSTCRNLVDYLGTKNITLINRTESKAAALALELGVMSAPITALDTELATADIILVSISSPEPIVLAKHFAGNGKKLVIDFSIPCTTEEAAQQLPNVQFVDVDMLSKIKDETLQARISEIPKAKAIIESLVGEFMEWYNMRKHVPVLKEVKSKLQEIQISAEEPHEEKIQKVINSLAVNIRNNNTPGCHYIQAINEFIA
ncbi:MAG: glutamyl-tRNA reductase [Flavipsychrobacter sp.]|nr:glutamyl-tRNA reductase [Flavipsychrobacter sp.]